MNHSKEELLEAKRQTESTLHQAAGNDQDPGGKRSCPLQTQITLAKRRIQAFTIALSLIERELEQSPEA